MASLEALERTLGRFRQNTLRVLEAEEVQAPVSPTDLIRLDQHGRKMVACPAGTSPPAWLELSEQEATALVPASEGPKAKVHVSQHGFNPQDVASGRIKINGPRD